jgi:hypothetical protein
MGCPTWHKRLTRDRLDMVKLGRVPPIAAQQKKPFRRTLLSSFPKLIFHRLNCGTATVLFRDPHLYDAGENAAQAA